MKPAYSPEWGGSYDHTGSHDHPQVFSRGKLIAQRTIASGNSSGARFWTDGKRVQPMFPDQPLLVKCRHCDALVWIDEERAVGRFLPWAYGKETFKDALPYDTPSAQDYFAILARGVSNRKKEKYLRLRAWWAGNDKRRPTGLGKCEEVPQDLPLSEEEIANLQALVGLLDQVDETHRFLMAEALRELGRFEEALALLSELFSQRLSPGVAIIRELAELKISSVREMKFIKPKQSM